MGVSGIPVRSCHSGGGGGTQRVCPLGGSFSCWFVQGRNARPDAVSVNTAQPANATASKYRASHCRVNCDVWSEIG